MFIFNFNLKLSLRDSSPHGFCFHKTHQKGLQEIVSDGKNGDEIAPSTPGKSGVLYLLRPHLLTNLQLVEIQFK